MPRWVSSVSSKSLPQYGQHEFPRAASDQAPQTLQRTKMFANGSRSKTVRMCLNKFISFPFARRFLLVSEGIPSSCRSSYRKKLVKVSIFMVMSRTLSAPSQKPSQKPEP